MNSLRDFQCHNLDEQHDFWTGRLPDALRLSPASFEELWGLHPSEYATITIHCKRVHTPRWQQAFGRDYHYTGQVSRAAPIPPLLNPLLSWARQAIDTRLNGMLVNWYDGARGHYIGPHRDSTKDLIPETFIVTISFGEERVFRLRPWHGPGRLDFPARDGGVFVMPLKTNADWTHQVPAAARYTGKRISVTVRAFSPDQEHGVTSKPDTDALRSQVGPQ